MLRTLGNTKLARFGKSRIKVDNNGKSEFDSRSKVGDNKIRDNKIVEKKNY